MNLTRRPLIAGNWKMNAGGVGGCDLAAEVARGSKKHARVDVLVSPPFTALAAVAHELHQAKSAVAMAGQNMHAEASGAYTGAISGQMLIDTGASAVILGHSERRQLFGESDEAIFGKLVAANALSLRPILCVGETLEQREAEQTLEVVTEQLRALIDELGEPGQACIAYEPVWAIGTGKVASPEDAQEVHAAIRALLAEVSPEMAEKTRILYGGSVKPNNAEGLLAQPDVDGALVGGAALQAESFLKIIEIAEKIAEQNEADAAEEPAVEEPPAEEPPAEDAAESEEEEEETEEAGESQ